MPVISQTVHPHSLDYANQRRAMILRDVKGMAFPDIAKVVKNVSGGHPTARTVANTYQKFSVDKGSRAFKYKKCGRRPWKLTKDNEAFIIRRMIAIRAKGVCTAETLRRELARERHVQVHVSTVQKVLKNHGYKWLPRNQKRKYSKEDMATRLAFAKTIADLTPQQANEKLNLSIDGVVITMPPKKPEERKNYCVGSETHMWRKPCEANMPALAGANPMSKQVPIDRSIPLWGGISPGGMRVIMFHSTKKVSTDEWIATLGAGKLKAALQAVNPKRKRGPWTVVCDNEGFLHARVAKPLYDEQRINLCHIPARSPDLNPIEKFWAWLRKQLVAMDFADLKKGKGAPGKLAYRERVRRLCHSQRAQKVATSIAKSWRKTCLAVVKAKGAGVRG